MEDVLPDRYLPYGYQHTHVTGLFACLRVARLIVAFVPTENGALPSVFPSIAGHEGSGKVVKVGKGVTRVKEGDSVLLSFSYCQKCKVRTACRLTTHDRQLIY